MWARGAEWDVAGDKEDEEESEGGHRKEGRQKSVKQQEKRTKPAFSFSFPNF